MWGGGGGGPDCRKTTATTFFKPLTDFTVIHGGSNVFQGGGGGSNISRGEGSRCLFP